jgi:hypothetical protein
MSVENTEEYINKLHLKKVDGTVHHDLTGDELNRHGEKEFKAGIYKGLGLAIDFLKRAAHRKFGDNQDETAKLLRGYAESLTEEQETQRKASYLVR